MSEARPEHAGLDPVAERLTPGGWGAAGAMGGQRSAPAGPPPSMAPPGPFDMAPKRRRWQPAR